MISNKKFIMVELTPPKNGDLSELLKSARQLKDYNITSVTFSDSPGGVCCVDSVLTAVKIREELGMDVIPHLCCRDKNALSLRSQILGAHANGIRNMLFITGDDVLFAKREAIKPVFDCNSVSLMNIAADLNHYELHRSPIRYGGGVNYAKDAIDSEIKSVKAKMQKGALFFFSRPVYCKEDADTVRTIAQETNAKIYCGVMPLVNRKNAEYVNSHISGVNVPQDIIESYDLTMTRDEGEAIGIENAKKMLAYIKDFTYGYYFHFPFNRVYLLGELLKDLT
ncbi:MAG: methylenetetrahydrofolate reductase [Clostridiales bacterium]